MATQLSPRISRLVCASFSNPCRSYSSVPLPPPPPSDAPLLRRLTPGTALRLLLETAGYCSFSFWLYRYDTFGIRKMNARWKGEKRKQEMLEKLDREKYESDDAYVEALGRELAAMKAELVTGEPDLLKKETFARAKEALEEKTRLCASLLDKPQKAARPEMGVTLGVELQKAG